MWTEDGTGAADFVIATFQITPNNPLNDPYMRYVIAPHAGPMLAIPPLGGTDSMYNPLAGDQVNATPGLVAATGGYDAARAHAFSVSDMTELVAAGGTVTVSYAGGNAPTLAPQ
jgi:hypothetical protein